MARQISLARVSVLILVAAFAGNASAQSTPDPAPRTDLTSTQLADFRSGLALFKTDMTATDDPREDDSCSDCHFRPAVGGNGFIYHGAIFYSFTYDRPLRELGVDRWPPQFQGPGPTPIHVTDQRVDTAIPVWANAMSRRVPRSLFGIGSVSLIPQSQILAHADPDDSNRDGISGRALGRYGSQGQFSSIDDTVRKVMTDELGVAASSVRSDDVRLLAAFLRGLRDPVQRLAGNSYALDGQTIFANIGCTDCHVRSYTLSTGRIIEPYSDFLVHDMGSCLDDGVALGSAKTYEWRTPPLWTSGDNNASSLHDGRGGRVDQVISFHCGEAARARDAYLALSQTEQAKIRAFLSRIAIDY